MRVKTPGRRDTCRYLQPTFNGRKGSQIMDVVPSCSRLPASPKRCLNYLKPSNTDPFGIVDEPDRPRPGGRGYLAVVDTHWRTGEESEECTRKAEIRKKIGKSEGDEVVVTLTDDCRN
jgi:hypothetical protein